MSYCFDHEMDVMQDCIDGLTAQGEPDWGYPRVGRFDRPIEKKQSKRRNAVTVIQDQAPVIRWHTYNKGAINVTSMEDSHLLNTIAYINRRVDEYNRVKEQATIAGKRIPAFLISGELASYWIDVFLTELDIRSQKRIADAKRVLEQEGAA